MSKFDQERLVSNLLLEYVNPPDYSELLYEIESYEFVILRCSLGLHPDTGKPFLPSWHKVLFTTSNCVIVQECEMTWNRTRFKVRKIDLDEWSDYFVEWMGTDHDRFSDARGCWEDGARMYGADV